MKCQKHPFPDQRTAEAALLEAKIRRALHNSNKRRETRVYLCECGAWHLTSQPQRTWPAARSA